LKHPAPVIDRGWLDAGAFACPAKAAPEKPKTAKAINAITDLFITLVSLLVNAFTLNARLVKFRRMAILGHQLSAYRVKFK
jgi:nitric oxide reductase large subunit